MWNSWTILRYLFWKPMSVSVIGNSSCMVGTIREGILISSFELFASILLLGTGAFIQKGEFHGHCKIKKANLLLFYTSSFLPCNDRAHQRPCLSHILCLPCITVLIKYCVFRHTWFSSSFHVYRRLYFLAYLVLFITMCLMKFVVMLKGTLHICDFWLITGRNE